MSRRATAVTCAASVASRTRTANSSPPSRPTSTPSPAAALDPPGDLGDDLVAREVAEGVVDGLEAVEVEDADGDRRPAAQR